MTGLEQSRHMCDMSQGIMEAKAKLLERRGSGIEDKNVKQLDKVKVSFVKKREFNWLTAVCLISCWFLRAEKKRRYESTLTQLSAMAKVHSSEGHQAELNGNVGIIALCFGVAARKEHFKSGGSCTKPNGNSIRFAKQAFKFAWCAQNARRLCVGCDGSSVCMVLVWCCKPSQTVSLTRLLPTERSAWAHLDAQTRDPIRLATGSQKEASCNFTLRSTAN